MQIKRLNYSLDKFVIKALSIFVSTVICSALIISPSYAAQSNMSGDYTKDTITVVKALKEAVEITKDSPDKDKVREESLSLITDYISRYRNRGLVNKTQSFTTMQTALNAMAGHYKNFATRPLPEKLKERLNKELSLAEKMVLRES
mgnify:CR=1 FL=1|tara:strand:+ start:2755 stop:3192 length:438 start_codon:yes stop_codon:yes gene_type:complete